MWIVYDDNLGIETFTDEEEALAEARSRLESYRESAACDGWSEEARSITVSRVTHKVVITDRISREEAQVDEEGFANDGTLWMPEWDETYNMKLKPVSEEQE